MDGKSAGERIARGLGMQDARFGTTLFTELLDWPVDQQAAYIAGFYDVKGHK